MERRCPAKRGLVPIGWLCLLLFSATTIQAARIPSEEAHTLEGELQAARTADKAGDYAAAAKHYQSFLDRVDSAKMPPQDLVGLRTRLATLYFLLHQFRDSLRIVEPLTRQKTSSASVPAQAWTVQGLDNLEINALPEAIESLRHALNLNPASGTARLALGDALARSDKLKEAIAEFKEQLRRTPDEVEAWYKLGLAYAFVAKKTSSEFWQRRPEDSVGLQLKAEGALSRGTYTEALRILFALMEKKDSQAGLHADVGMALLYLGFPQTAEVQFQKELTRDPYSPDALFGLSATLSLRGDWAGAAAKLDKLAQTNHQELARLVESPPPIVLRQAFLQKPEAIPASFLQTRAGTLWHSWLKESGADHAPTNADLGRPCSQTMVASGLVPGAWMPAACYRQAVNRLREQPNTSPAERDKIAEAELRAGAVEDAEATASQALESNPSDGWALYWLVGSYEALGNKAFRRVSELNPNSARVHQMVAKYYSDKHETARAAAEYDAGLKLSPNLPDLYSGLGTVYWEAGDWDRAEPPLRRALELSPSLIGASYELGDVYVQKRQWELAVRYLRPAEGDPTLNYQACSDLSKAEAGLGHTEKAIDYLTRLAAQDQDGEIHYRLAVLYRKLGESTKAEAAFAASNQLRQASLQHGQDVLETMEKERKALEQADR